MDLSRLGIVHAVPKLADPSTESTAHRVGVYGWSPGSGGVHHHRIREPLRVLGEHGVAAASGPILNDEILCQVDTVVVHMLHGQVQSRAWADLAQLQSHRLIFDVDDWMWEPDWRPFKDNYTPDVLARVERNIRRAHVVTTPTAELATRLSAWNENVWIVPNTVPAWLLGHDMPARERPTVGVQGSPSHMRDWTPAQAAQLARWLRDWPTWGLHMYGSRPGALGASGRVLHTPWSDIDTFYRTVSYDVGVGPLRDTVFNACKSDLRAREMAALGIIAALPDLAPYRDTIRDGVTGRLIGKHQTMRQVLNDICEDDAGRLAMSTNARRQAQAFTTEANIGRWLEAWHSR